MINHSSKNSLVNLQRGKNWRKGKKVERKSRKIVNHIMALHERRKRVQSTLSKETFREEMLKLLNKGEAINE